MRLKVTKKLPVVLLILSLIYGKVSGQTVGPKLDLKVRHVRSTVSFSGWRFEVLNHDDQPVKLSDLEVRFWVHGKSVVAVKTWAQGSLENLNGKSLESVSGLEAHVQHLKRFTLYPANAKAEWGLNFKPQSDSVIPAGGRWKDVYFEYYLKNWGAIEDKQSYSQAPPVGPGKEYFDNPTVGLYYQGALVAEWKNAGELDDKTGKTPFPIQAVLNAALEQSPIVSPVDGEQVCGVVQVGLAPQGSDWQLEWSSNGEAWQPIEAEEKGNGWLAAWDVRGLKPGSYQIRLVNDSNGAIFQKITVNVGDPQFVQDFQLPNHDTPGGLGLRGSNVAVLDYQSQTIQVFSSTGSVLQSLGSYGTRSNEFNQAFDMTFDSNGQLYVADTGNGRVDVLNAASGLLGDGLFVAPSAVKSCRLGISVLDGTSVHLFDLTGQYLYSGWLSGSCADVAMDDVGNLYAVNNKNRSIDVYDTDFNLKTSWSGPFGNWSPANICYSNGRIFVSDTQKNQVLKLDLSGNCLASWGGYGLADGQFDQPGKMFVDANGGIYVSDMGNGRVEQFKVPVPANKVASTTPTVSPTATGGLVVSGLSATASQGQVSLTYTLNQSAQVQESVQDDAGNILVKQVYSAGTYGGQNGLNHLSWNTTQNGAPISGGSYTITLIATDKGQVSQVQTVIYVTGANTPLASAVNTSTAQTPTATGTPSGIVPTVVYTPTLSPTSVPPTATATAVLTATSTSIGVQISPTTAYTATFTTTMIPPTATETRTPTAVPPTATYTFTKTPVTPTATFTPQSCGTPTSINVRPYLQCVKSMGGGQYAAYFGYINDSTDACGNRVIVSIPWGSRNDIDPNLAGTPPINFSPGTQTAFIALIQSGQTIRWTLNGETVIANSSSSLCH